MPSFRIDRARRYLDRLAKVPLFGKIGEPVDDSNVIAVKSVADYVKAMQSSAWDKMVGRNALNHRLARIIDAFGMDWFQEQNDECIEDIWDELDKRKTEQTIKKIWKKQGIPTDIDPYIDTVQWAYNFVASAAYDHAVGFSEDDTFDMKYVSPCLLSGHLPCGWSGKVPGEPKEKSSGKPPYSGKDLEVATGNGKLKVF